MKRYEFRMAKVLRVRRLQEDAARAAVAAARAAEDAAVASLGESQAHYAARPGADATQPVNQFLAVHTRGEWRGQAVVQARVRRQMAADDTGVAVDGWHVANRRVEGLERLDERRRSDYAVLTQRDEDAAVDEIMSARARRTA